MPTSTPVAVFDTYTVPTTHTLSVLPAQGLRANDTDADNNPLTVTAVNGQTNAVGQALTLFSSATLTLNADGSFEYAGSPNWLGSELVSYTVSNGTNTALGSVTFQPPLGISALYDQTSKEGDSVSVYPMAMDAGMASLTWSATGLPTGLSINATTGTISGTLAAGTRGSYITDVTVTNGTDTATQAFAWTIDSRVQFSPVLPPLGREGDTISLPVLALLPGGGTLAYSATGLPSGLTINSGTGLISGTLPPDIAGIENNVVVTATDGTYTGSVGFAWTVDARVSIPAIENQYASEGDSVLLQVLATIPGGATLTYSATGLPDGVSINTTTGAITGTLAADTADNIGQVITVSATDGTYTGTQYFVWVIDPRIVVTPVEDRADAEGETISVQVTATTPGTASLTYSATGLPSGLSINATTGVISGVLSSTSATEGEPEEVTVTVTDGTYTSAISWLWTVETEYSDTDLVGASDSYTLEGDEALSEEEATLLANDAAMSGTLTVTAINGASSAVNVATTLTSGATLLVDALGRVQYTAATGFVGVDTFTYTVSNGVTSVLVPVFVNVLQPAQGPTFAELFRENLKQDRWDLNNDAKITLAEINILFDKPEIKGANAAALAALKAKYTQLQKLIGERWEAGSGISLKGIEHYEALAKLTADQLKQLPPKQFEAASFVQHLEREFARYHERLKNTDRKILYPGVALDDLVTVAQSYTPTMDKLNATTIQQGAGNDCAFLTTIIAAIHSKTENWFTITVNPQGQEFRYEVKFAGHGTKIKISELTDSQIALYANAGADGLWLSVLEKAYAQIRQYSITNFPGPWFQQNAYDALKNEAGSWAMRTLTGRKVLPLWNAFGLNLTPQLAKVEKAFTDNLDNTATTAVKPFKIMMTATSRANADWGDPTKDKTLILPPTHQYAVLGYDPINQLVLLRNPWMVGGKYGSTFSMKIDEFCDKFSILDIDVRP